MKKRMKKRDVDLRTPASVLNSLVKIHGEPPPWALELLLTDEMRLKWDEKTKRFEDKDKGV